MPFRYRNPRQGERFARWLDATKGVSGVYVFRGAWTGRVEYVGESHTNALYKTITRHFWSWPDGRRPHYVVPLLQPVDVAVRVTSAARARALQDRLEARLRPTYSDKRPAYTDEIPF